MLEAINKDHDLLVRRYMTIGLIRNTPLSTISTSLFTKIRIMTRSGGIIVRITSNIISKDFNKSYEEINIVVTIEAI